MKNFKREKIAEGIFFNAITDEKFKSNRISINIFTPIDEKKSAANSVLACMLPKANKNISNMSQMNKITAKMYGAVLDCNVSATGDNQYITLYIQTIDNKYALSGEDLIHQTADLLCDCLLSPKMNNCLLDEDIFSTEKQFIIDTIESEINDKRTYALKKLKMNMFDGEPYGIGKFGSLKEAQKLTIQDVTEAYHHLIESAKFEILFTGCGNSDKILQHFKERFIDINRKNIVSIDNVNLPSRNKVKQIEETMDVSQSKLAMGFKTENISTYEENCTYKMMTLLFGGTPNSRLFTYVREKLSLCYYCAANYGKQKNYICVDSGIEKDKKDVVINEVLNQLEIIKKGDFDENDLVQTKLYIVNRLKSVRDSLSSVEQWYLSQIIDGNKFSPEDEVEVISKITKNMIKKAATNVTLDTIYFLTGK